MAFYKEATVTIANGAAVSDSIQGNDLSEADSFTIAFPSAWTAADLGFEVSDDDGATWLPFRDAVWGRVRIQNVATGAAAVVAVPAELWGVTKHALFRLVSLNTSTGANENQLADRTLTLRFFD